MKWPQYLWNTDKINSLEITDKPKFLGFAKSASDKGQIGSLKCKAQGAPDISFIWSRSGRVIRLDHEPGEEGEELADHIKADLNKYEIKSEMIDR